jgi:hypothetical protein
MQCTSSCSRASTGRSDPYLDIGTIFIQLIEQNCVGLPWYHILVPYRPNLTLARPPRRECGRSVAIAEYDEKSHYSVSVTTPETPF